MSLYKVTTNVIELVQKLVEEGYTGTVELVNSYPAGASSFLENDFSMKLSGFCKESLYISENTSSGELDFVGRYGNIVNLHKEDACVKDIVDTAWYNFLDYESRGYNMPTEFYSLFIKYDKIKEKVVTSTVVERI